MPMTLIAVKSTDATKARHVHACFSPPVEGRWCWVACHRVLRSARVVRKEVRAAAVISCPRCAPKVERILRREDRARRLERASARDKRRAKARR